MKIQQTLSLMDELINAIAIAQIKFDNATTDAEKDESIYLLKAHEIRLNEYFKTRKNAI